MVRVLLPIGWTSTPRTIRVATGTSRRLRLQVVLAPRRVLTIGWTTRLAPTRKFGCGHGSSLVEDPSLVHRPHKVSTAFDPVGTPSL